ncbi:hypothetical protein UlMin_002800 [Ulmus minor]
MFGFYRFSLLSLLCFSVLFSFVSSHNKNALIVRDRAALVSFMSGIVSDPQHALEDWNSWDVHVCNWSGVRCNNAKEQVVELDLSGRSLRGTISPSLANLSSLSILDLSRNLFHGQIPKELGFLSKLEQISLSSNLLDTNIPFELGFLHRLVYLDLGSNRLKGPIPFSLFCNGSSSSLQYIDLSNNSLSGEIPLKNECELKQLRFLLLWSNQFVGRIPPSLSNSTKLEWLDLESNMLSGELPCEIVRKMPQLQFLYLSYNHFVSHDGNTNLEPFFSSLANSSNFQELELAGNNIGGIIPSSIGDLSSANLLQIHLDQNLISGSIPPHISKLVNLTFLNLSSNLLNGTIPLELCRMRKLERVYLSNNSLSGEIPSAVGDISHLGLLDLSRNKLSGSIPDSFSNLSQLRRLLLYGNKLSGKIPPSLGKCINLEILDLSHNQLSGVIPREVAGLRSLKLYLNFSSNHLHGLLPMELSKMDMVLAIDLSSNNLSGTIPPQLGSCIALEQLNLSRNFLEGPLPVSIGQLPYLRQLDVSSNHLTGEIPQSLQASSTLKLLNFSFNNFSGNVSSKGVFSFLSIDSFLGNEGLCGSIKGMSRCRRKHNHHLIIIPIVLSIFGTFIMCIFCYSLVLKSKIRNQMAIFNRGDIEDGEGDKKDLKYPRISYQQLIDATGGFSPSSLIGSGQFGHVYKGVLQDNTRIAVKVFDLKAAGIISASFKRECQILKRTKHRNLIRIITICSRPDFKALVLPLMSNGSLERHLYPSHGLRNGLNLAHLVNICSDVAEAVAYLHHHSPVRVVHCDLKPSNILLNEDMTALVTDFGIARLLKGGDESNIATDDSISFSSADGLLCGSVGYIAPEYGLGRRASTQGDVYSFGVLLLEIVTGKRPTDGFSVEGSSLHDWVKSHFPGRLQPIVEQAMEKYAQEVMPKHYNKIWINAILELIELGLMCTQYNPSTRPNMQDVAHEMGRLKEYLSDPSAVLIEHVLDPKI